MGADHWRQKLLTAIFFVRSTTFFAQALTSYYSQVDKVWLPQTNTRKQYRLKTAGYIGFVGSNGAEGLHMVP